MLEALIEPSKRLAPGYGVVNLTLRGGQMVAGILMEENEEELILKTSEAEPIEIPIERIETRINAPSSMPPMGQILTKRVKRCNSVLIQSKRGLKLVSKKIIDEIIYKNVKKVRIIEQFAISYSF